MVDTFRYKAFISYSRTDEPFAADLHRRLEGYVMPVAMRKRDGGLQLGRKPVKPVFFDNGELVPGASLPDRIAEAIAASEYLILVCSPESALRPWVQEEVRLFVRRHGVANVICVVCAGEPMANAKGFDSASEAFPESYRDAIAMAGDEPLWIDARGRGRIDRMNLLRVVAAVFRLGSLDQLVQRDRARRIRSLVSAALIVAAVALIVAATLWFQSRSAAFGRADALERLAESASDEGDHERAGRYLLESLHMRAAYFSSDVSPVAETLLRRVHAMSRLRWALDFDPSEGGTVRYSGDGRYLLVSDGSSDRVYDVVTRRLLLRGERGSIEPLDVVNDQGAVVDWTKNELSFRKIRTSTATARIAVDLEGGESLLDVSADAKRALIGSESNARLVDVSSGKIVASFTAKGKPRLSAGGKWVVVDHDSTIELISQHDGRRVTIPGGEFLISPDDRSLAVLGDRINIYDTATGRLRATTPPDKVDDGNLALDLGSGGHRFAEHVFSKDSRQIMICHIRLCLAWSSASGQEVARYERESLDRALPRISPNGQRLAIHENGQIQVVDFASGTPLLAIEAGPIEDLAFSPDGRQLAIASRRQGLSIYDLRGLPITQKAEEDQNDDDLSDFLDSGMAAVWSGDTAAWNSAHTAMIVNHDDRPSEIFAPDGTDVAQVDKARVHDVDPARRHAVIETREGRLVLRSLTRGVADRPIKSVGPEGANAQFSPNGKTLILEVDDRRATIILWDIDKGERLRVQKSWASALTQTAMSGDGRYLAALSPPTTFYPGAPVEIWNTGDGKLAGTLARSAREAAPDDLLFLNPSRYVATVSESSITVWDIETRIPVVWYETAGYAGHIVPGKSGFEVQTIAARIAIDLPPAMALKRDDLAAALCRDRLRGSLRRLTAADVALAPMLAQRQGADVCA